MGIIKTCKNETSKNNKIKPLILLKTHSPKKIYLQFARLGTNKLCQLEKTLKKVSTQTMNNLIEMYEI